MAKGTPINWDAQPLGQVTDAALADALGCTPSAVYAARKKRGVRPAPSGSRFQDHTGQRFGMLTCLRVVERGRRVIWLVRCDCGIETRVIAANLKSQQSCGCRRSAVAAAVGPERGRPRLNAYVVKGLRLALAAMEAGLDQADEETVLAYESATTWLLDAVKSMGHIAKRRGRSGDEMRDVLDADYDDG